MHRKHRLFSLSTDAQTSRIARALAPHLAPGDALLLTGDVGAGKTHFARALIQEMLTHPEDVPSPTFTLVQVYDSEKGDIWHADLYRLGDPSEVDELGLIDAFEDAICLIEWPDRLGDLRPANALDIMLEATEAEAGRNLTATWSDPKWDAKLAKWNL